jgi:small-conductance mechanosensitive channel
MSVDERNEQKEQVEQLKQRGDVREALEKTARRSGRAPRRGQAKDRVRLGVYLALMLAAAVFYYLSRFGVLVVPLVEAALVQRIAIGVGLIAFAFAFAKVVEVYAIGAIPDVGSRFNLQRLTRLVTWLVVAFIAVSVLFENWYTAVVSLGLISIILGFALQTPVTSLIGWVYLITRAPYRVGDRIRIGDLTGDVIDVSYVDTTLWEFGGEYLSTDHPSGRLIKFPNATVLDTPIINYSWPLFPYIWNEIKLQIAYQSNLEVVAATIQKVIEEEIGEEMMQRIRAYRELLEQTAVDHLDVHERPAVFFRVSENTWLEVIVRYLVEPKKAGRVKSRLIPKVIAALNEKPDAVLFPRLDLR